MAFLDIDQDGAAAHGMSSVGVAISGVGMVTPLGAGAQETWESLLAGRFILDHSRAAFEIDGGQECPPYRVNRLAICAAREAIAEAEWSGRELAEDGAALVVGTSKGPVEGWLSGAAGGVDLAGIGEVAAEVARAVGLGCGPRMTISAACASGLEALIRGVTMIRWGEAERVLVVAAESSLHPLFLGSFARLGVLPGAGVGCRPFDETREGFLMSEAAAAVCLERGGGGICIERVAMGGDATHLTGGDTEGRTMRRLLRSVIDHRAVDLVHAHGTGTVANDATELAAIEAALPESRDRPILYSHKGALGHSLGAAGLVAVVISVMCHRMGVVPGNVQLRRALACERVRLSAAAETARIRRSVVLASGFGGAAAGVSLVGG
jgi:3-oxoacyl-[acyl-carrier-protein] synthase II